MKNDVVLLANHMLNRLLSYKSAIVKCRPIINDKLTIFDNGIAHMTTEDIKESFEEESKRSSKKTTNGQMMNRIMVINGHLQHLRKKS